MNCEIIRINDNTWRIEDGGVRFFLLAGTEKALLIDSGMTVHNAKDIAESLTELPVFLLNTHADRDHIGSNEQFGSFYMHPVAVDTIKLLHDGAQNILAGKVRGEEAEMRGTRITAYDLGFCTILCDKKDSSNAPIMIE